VRTARALARLRLSTHFEYLQFDGTVVNRVVLHGSTQR